MPIPEAFARDLNYLDKFFDKLEGHGRGLQGPLGPMLVEAIAHQREEWQAIKGMLEGRAPAPKAAKPAPVPAQPPAAPAEAPKPAGGAALRRTGFTVGSLYGR